MVKLLNRAIVRLQLRKCYNYKGGFTMEEKLAASAGLTRDVQAKIFAGQPCPSS